MGMTDRREKLALDNAYDFYISTLHAHDATDLYSLANSLKTVCIALKKAEEGQLELTTRLWLKIKQALFDRLLTSCGAFIVVITPDGRILGPKEELPEDGTLELHPEGLKRKDDIFHMEIKHLHPSTRTRLNKIWLERGPTTRQGDFVSSECTNGICSVINTFVVGNDVLRHEANTGKKKAYNEWWTLYWQAYCAPDEKEKQILNHKMSSLEEVWGNLCY